MLSKRENYTNWIALKFLSKFCIIPFDFNPQTEEIRKSSSALKRLIWNCYFFIYCVYVLYLAFTFCTLIHNSITYGTFNFNHFSIHVMYMVGSPLMGLFTFNCKKWAGVLSIVSNELTDKIQNNGQNSRTQSKLSLQKLIIIVCPVLALIGYTFGDVVVFADPTRPQLLFQLLSDDHKTLVNFLILGAIEYSIGALGVGCVYFGINLQLLFFEHLHHDLSFGIQSLKNSKRFGFIKRHDLQHAIRHCRHLHILIQLFNRSNAAAIFYYPIVALFDVFVGLSVMVTYIVMYEKALKIPQQIAEYKNLILIAVHPGLGVLGRSTNLWAQVVGRTNERNALKISRGVRSIPNIGIKVGGFSTMERASTLNFIDFFTSHVASLLITFK